MPNTFAGYSERRALELILSGLETERVALENEIIAITETLLNGNPGYGHLPNLEPKTRKTRTCGNCGKPGHDVRNCPKK